MEGKVTFLQTGFPEMIVKCQSLIKINNLPSQNIRLLLLPTAIFCAEFWFCLSSLRHDKFLSLNQKIETSTTRMIANSTDSTDAPPCPFSTEAFDGHDLAFCFLQMAAFKYKMLPNRSWFPCMPMQSKAYRSSVISSIPSGSIFPCLIFWSGTFVVAGIFTYKFMVWLPQ